MVIEAQVVATLLPPIVPILVLVQFPIPQDARQSLASNLVVFATAIAVVQATATIVIEQLAISSIPLFSKQFHSALHEDMLFLGPYHRFLQLMLRSTLASEACAIAPQSDPLFHHVQPVVLFVICGKLSSLRLLQLKAKFRAFFG